MRSKFQQRPRTDNTVCSLWENAKQSILETANEVLGKEKGNRREWLSSSFWHLIETRRSKKEELLGRESQRSCLELQREITTLTKQIKRKARSDKRAFLENLANEAEVAASKGDMREVFNITRKLSDDKSNRTVPLKDCNGNLVTMEEEQLKIWREHFSKTFNVITSNEDLPQMGQPRLPLRNICTDPPTKQEITSAIGSLKNGKAAGIDNIPAECLKADIEGATDMLHPLFRDIWNSEKIPSDWKESIIIKIPKKGNLSECSNWRGISLVSVVSKVFNKIILNRIMDPINAQLRKQQCGFRPNRSCIDNINSMRAIIEQSIEFNSTLYAVFVDYEKAFDSIKRNCIWLALQRKGVPEKIINIIRKSYEQSKCKVLHNGKLSDPFDSTTGVKQGCILSPLLFIVVLDWVLEIFNSQNRGINWRLNSTLEDMEYADDIVLLSHSHQHMQSKLTQLHNESSKVGLKINIQKTESMRVKSSNTSCFVIGTTNLRDVESFTYLGSVLTIDGGAKQDIINRIQKARGSFARLRAIWRAHNIRTDTKIKIFNACVKSVLLYGSETWLVTTETKMKIQTFVNRCLRNIMGIWWPNTIATEELWRLTGQTSVNTEIQSRKYRWIGHTLRKPYDDIPHAALTWNPQGSRRRGRPTTTWKRTVLTETGKSFNELRQIAQNRSRWKSFVVSLSS